jgi:dGTPase
VAAYTGAREERIHQPDKRGDQRRQFERDRDRILYSSAFRRLGGVTQVVWAQGEGYLFHNRLTHSLKVGQIGRRISEMLIARASDGDGEAKAAIAHQGLEPEVVEAAGLAHDLGHPPFGHIAEQELNAALRGVGVLDGFEGNAQTFRILARLARIGTDQNGDPITEGLNLTRATINAVLKYPWAYAEGEDKWGYYSTDPEEHRIFQWARASPSVVDGKKTLEAQIMDWADDITYAVHDVEDFYRAGLVPLQELPDWTSAQRRQLSKRVRRAWEKLRGEEPLTDDEFAAAEAATIDFPWVSSRYAGTPDNRAELREALSAAISRFVQVTTVHDGNLSVDRSIRAQIAILKELTRYLVIEGPHLGTQQHGQRRVIRDLFRIFWTSAHRKRLSVFPGSVRDEATGLMEAGCPEPDTARFVSDLIAGMTEVQAVHMFHRLTGIDFGSFTDPAVS